MIGRVLTALEWRRRAWLDVARDDLFHRLARHDGRTFIRWRWPLGITKPYLRRDLMLRAPGLGIGDNLMCTPILREIKRRNPGCTITLLTKHPSLFEGLGTVDHLVSDFDPTETDSLLLRYDHLAPRRRSGAESTAENLYAGYAHPIAPPRPLITIMAECAGLELSATQLECASPVVSDEFRTRLASIGTPYLVVQPEASSWTPLKNWPAERWVAVVRSLLSQYTVVEVGSTSVLAEHISDPRFVSLAGQTTVSEMVHVIANAAAFAGPDSGGMHVANAFHVPSVIVFGGYSSPEMFGYPRMQSLVGATPCAPCMLTTPCPFDRKCLTMIPVSAVTDAIHAALRETDRHVKIA